MGIWFLLSSWWFSGEQASIICIFGLFVCLSVCFKWHFMDNIHRVTSGLFLGTLPQRIFWCVTPAKSFMENICYSRSQWLGESFINDMLIVWNLNFLSIIQGESLWLSLTENLSKCSFVFCCWEYICVSFKASLSDYLCEDLSQDHFGSLS